ncbi:hypothetical protein HUW51_15825 [Adhaeribacter swui]|uniref:Uncharacterized protein n=1 Tax=Adhaeribacter swui TaxID=2086471 RepID=A0A7G7GAD3_9BACT|nr:hypothetical protein [Adhaeribacter swui]QNF34117.1 hypothetical protein HUW51_15825 [Adhaeribacter swui]
MTKFLLFLGFTFLGLAQTKAQLKMTKAEARETMSEMAFTVEKKTEQKNQFQFIHYSNTKINMNTILRFNQADVCDLLITVLPLSEWEKSRKAFENQVTTGLLKPKASGKNTWIKEDGSTIVMVPEPGKNTFSIVVSSPAA